MLMDSMKESGRVQVFPQLFLLLFFFSYVGSRPVVKDVLDGLTHKEKESKRAAGSSCHFILISF